MYEKITRAECDELLRQANRERATKSAATRRMRQWLGCLYALEDTREQPEALKARLHSPDDSVDFLERLYSLEDPRGKTGRD